MAVNKAPMKTGGGSVKQASPGAFNVHTLEQEDRHKWLNLLVYGPHGAGKTTLLASAADVEEMQDVLVVTAEGGTVVFENNDRIANWKGLDIIKIDRIEQFSKVYDFLKAHIAWRDDPDKEEKLQGLQDMVLGEEAGRLRRYRTVIVDSLSEIEAQNLAKILDLDSLGLDAGDDMEVAGFPQFRKNNHIIQRIVRQFRDLDIHVLMTCAQSYSQDERKVYHYSPKLTGQLRTNIQGFFDVVGWLVVGNKSAEDEAGPRRLFVQPQSSPKADAKCRLAGFKEEFLDNPVMADVVYDMGVIKQ